MGAAFNFLAPARAHAQTPTVPLGTAAQFGLLSGGTLTTDSASAPHVAGQAGAATAIIGSVQTSSTPESGGVTTALAQLTNARTYCAGLTAQPLTAPLNGQILTGGAYTLTGNVTFGSGNPLVLRGTDTTVFVVTVTGNLTLTAGATVRLEGGIAPKNIVWNVGGDVSSTGYAVFPGVVLAGGDITATGIWAATSALLGAGNVSLTQLRFAPMQAGSEFVAPALLLPPAACASPTSITLSTPCVNRVFNGDFETPDPTLATGLPTDNANVCNRSVGPRYLTKKELAGWGAATWGTPDWFKSGGAAGIADVPTNTFSTTLASTPAHGGSAYTGLYACSNFLPPTGPTILGREYLLQTLPIPAGQITPLLAGVDYYAEFYSRLAPTSNFTVPGLGLTTFATDPYQDQSTGLLLQPGGATPVVPLISAHDANFNQVNAWSRTAGFFLANGSEKYLAIGNFGSETPVPIPGRTSSGFTEDSYQYIDDVQLVPFPLPVITCGTLNGQPNARLDVDCPLPLSSGALYRWTWTDPCQTTQRKAGSVVTTECLTPPLQHTVESTNPVFFPPYPYAASYTLTVSVPIPGISPVQYYVAAPHSVQSNTLFAFTIDETMPAAQNIGSPLNPTTSVTWDADKTIRGTITVWPNATLVIRNQAVIRFDDTFRQNVVAPPLAPGINTNQALPSRILVKPGGKLQIYEGAVLTSLIAPDPFPADPNRGAVPSICHNPYMWDGVTVEGTGSGTSLATAQTPDKQGVLDISQAGTIAHARYGVIVGNWSYSTQTYNVPAPGYTGQLIKFVHASRGGGIVKANGAHFLECHHGAVFVSYRRGSDPNVSTFDDCLIQSNVVLADPIYQTNGIRYGTPRGVVLYATNNMRFTGNTFDGYSAVPVLQRGWGLTLAGAAATIETDFYDGGNRTLPTRPNLFQDWYSGVNVTNSFEAMAVRARGNKFINNQLGLNLQKTPFANVRYNQFLVGGPGLNQPSGLYCEESNNSTPEDNWFSPNPAGPGATAVGLTVKNVIKLEPGQVRPPLLVYRNTFTELYTGLYAFGDNQEVFFRCNTFNSAAASTGATNLPSADVHVHAGTVGTQGSCNGGANTTANNTFGPSLTGRFHIFLRASDPSGNNGGLPFEYWRPLDPNMNPNQNSGDVSPGMVPEIQLCGIQTNGNGCGANPESEDVGGLQAALLAAPVGSAERTAVLGRLITELLVNATITHGLDTAVAVLTREQNPAFAEQLEQLALTLANGQGGGNAGLRAAAPTGRTPVASAARSNSTDKRASTAPTAPVSWRQNSYAARVRQLLWPLGSDSARTVAVLTNEALRAELQQMAEDSLTPGASLARNALNQYAGANYNPVLSGTDDAEAGDAGLNRAAGPPPARLLVVPNPSAGEVQVTYQLPAPAAHVVLRVYDEWGQHCGEHQLAVEAQKQTQGLRLHLRRGIYQCLLLTDGHVVAKERLLITP